MTATTTINSTSVKPRAALQRLRVMVVPSSQVATAPDRSKREASVSCTLYLAENVPPDWRGVRLVGGA